MRALTILTILAGAAVLAGCGDDSDDETESARVALHNDFNNEEFERRPPWIICESHYNGTEFGAIPIGETSERKEVSPGLGYVYLVAAWDDPSCAAENCLPIASRQEEEVVPGQTRTIALNVPNHQGPCPPEGVQPIPQQLYDRILELWPEYGFLPYEQRTENPECLSE
jgi:hypothetical protein